MKKHKKTISYLLLLLSFTILISDCKSFFQADTQIITTHNNRPDISDHFEHIHSHTTDENIIISSTLFKLTQLLSLFTIISATHIEFTSNFISNIWQPPKFS